MKPGKIIKPIVVLSLLFILLSIIMLSIGTVFINPADVIVILGSKLSGVELDSIESDILIAIRLPRLLATILVGASLAAAGAIFQGLIRNPLGDPYLIGVSSGAGLGMVISGFIGLHGFLFGLPAAALLGGLVAVLVVYCLAKSGGKVHTMRLILAGIVVSAFLSALMMFLISRADSTTVKSITFWMMGDLGGIGLERILSIFPYFILTIILVFLISGKINVIMLGDELAGQLGISVEKIKIMALAAASLLTGIAVASAGVIGFIGLIVPNLVRYIWGSDFRVNFLLSSLAGAILLMGADITVRLLTPVSEMPVGIVTALIGAPFFIHLLLKAKD